MKLNPLDSVSGNRRENNLDPACTISLEMRLALEQLSQASRYCADLACDRWEFAVEIDRLLGVGLNTSDLRWLVKRGFLDHRRETTKPDSPSRTFAKTEKNLAFGKATCFILTDNGIAALRVPRESLPLDEVASNDTLPMNTAPMARGAEREQSILAFQSADLLPLQQQATGGSSDDRFSKSLPKDFLPSTIGQSQVSRHGVRTTQSGVGNVLLPNWDRVERTLLVGETVIKRYRVPSPNQEALLNAFQEEGWPTSIDDPLTPIPDKQPKRRLRDTIKCLNLNQATPMLRFRGDGTGQRVLWELTAGQVSVDPINAGQKQRDMRRAA